MTGTIGHRSPLTWLGALLALYLLGPIGYFVYRFARTSHRGLGEPGVLGALVTSAETASISTAIIAVLGIPLAYWLARSGGPAARIIGVLVQLPLALPPVMSGIVLIYVVGPYTPIGAFFDDRLINSLAGVVLAQVFVASPFLIIAARSAFADIEPALFDLAATSGHRPLAAFARVALPVAAGGIQAGLLLTWLRALGEYGATVLLAYNPHTLPVFTEIEVGSTGLPGTLAPTAYALLLAVVALGLNQLRRPRRWHHRTPSVRPEAPRASPPTPVSFDLDLTVGTFRLTLAYAASSPHLAILGPSGSGKSVTLRAVAGLYGPSAGTVAYAGRPMQSVPTPRRRVGYVPQGQGLIPNRTVWRQVMFGVDADAACAAWWLDTLRLSGFGERTPRQLSGGQRQRVSLAQALARSPRLVLLDEPFSALDTPVRAQLRTELRRLQRETGLSTVLVTHDPEEAALLADEVIVIDDGRLLQAGPRAEVFGRPASAHVARLLGIENVHGGRVTAPGSLLAGSVTLVAPAASSAGDVLWCVRPEHVVVAAAGDHAATLLDAVDLGTGLLLTVRLDGGPTLQARAASCDLVAGARCAVVLDPARVLVWSGQRG